MKKEIIAQGKDVLEAKDNARAALGAGPLDDVNFEILHAGSRGIFGIIGVKPAQVKAWMEIPDPEERHRRKSEKPRRESKPEGDRPADKKQKQKHNQPKKENKPKEEKEKSKVIPELELKLEPKTVGEGEDMSFDFVKTVISDIGLSAEASLYTCEDGTRRIIIAGDDASTLIGHHGDTLDALQYLANLASARKNVNGERDKSRVTIDIEGYRAKREETLRALARRMAAKALRNRRSVMLEPIEGRPVLEYNDSTFSYMKLKSTSLSRSLKKCSLGIRSSIVPKNIFCWLPLSFFSIWIPRFLCLYYTMFSHFCRVRQKVQSRNSEPFVL